MHRYKHIITESKCSKSEDMLGGILADGMGLGKTLTMITGILASLAQADEFAKSNHLNNKIAEASKIPVKSTLVIVPSTG